MRQTSDHSSTQKQLGHRYSFEIVLIPIPWISVGDWALTTSVTSKWSSSARLPSQYPWNRNLNLSGWHQVVEGWQTGLECSYFTGEKNESFLPDDSSDDVFLTRTADLTWLPPTGACPGRMAPEHLGTIRIWLSLWFTQPQTNRTRVRHHLLLYFLSNLIPSELEQRQILKS